MSPLIREYAALVPFNPVEYVWIDFASGPLPTPEQSEEITRRLGQLPYTYETPIEEWPLPFEQMALLMPVVMRGQQETKANMVLTMVREGAVLKFELWSNASQKSLWKGKDPVPSVTLLALYSLTHGFRPFVSQEFKKATGRTGEECVKFASDSFRVAWRRLMAMVMLNQAPAVVASCTGDAVLNAKRRRKGKRPFFEWTTVEVKPRAAVQESKGGTHASPKPHMRRGHVRKLKSGKIVTIKPMIVNKHKMPDEGFVFHDYKVAALT